MDFDAIEDRADVSTFDVPRETIGFLLGKSGITLRGMENKYSVFMFLDNDRQREGKHGPCKRLYVVGNGNDREAALDEAEQAVVPRVDQRREGAEAERLQDRERAGGAEHHKRAQVAQRLERLLGDVVEVGAVGGGGNPRLEGEREACSSPDRRVRPSEFRGGLRRRVGIEHPRQLRA